VWYHYSQLRYGPDVDLVKYALLIDYITAAYAIAVGLKAACDIVITSGVSAMPIDSVFEWAIGVIFLFASWREGLNKFVPYMIFHGLWHLFSAEAALSLGKAADLVLQVR
jgi:hypothetical protein